MTKTSDYAEKSRLLGEEVIALRTQIAVLQKACVRSSDGQCACIVCGGVWPDGGASAHIGDCAVVARRASSSAQNSRGAASKRKR